MESHPLILRSFLNVIREVLYTGKLLTNNIVFKKKFWYICEKYYPVVIQTDMEISISACISRRGFGCDTMQLA